MSMPIHNLHIYHCQNCGRVVHQEPHEETPQCCDAEMAKAAAETVPQEQAAEARTGPRPQRSKRFRRAPR